MSKSKVNLGYMKSKVLVGLASGLNLGNLGFTHCSIEEIGVLRSIPNIQIVVPADCLELNKAVESYLSQGNMPCCYSFDWWFKYQANI